MNAVCQALLAGARFALQKNVIVAAGNARSLMLQSKELARFANHAVQAVARAVTRCMGNGRFQVFNRHAHNQRAFNLAANFYRHNGGNVFISAVLRNPGNFAAVRRRALQSLFNGNMLIIKENILKVFPAFEAFFSIAVAVFQFLVLPNPVNGNRQFFHHHFLDAPVFKHLQMLLNGIFHR